MKFMSKGKLKTKQYKGTLTTLQITSRMNIHYYRRPSIGGHKNISTNSFYYNNIYMI